MITTTLNELIKNEVEDDYNMYAFHDGDGVCLYVGRSKDAIERVKSHVGKSIYYPWGKSSVVRYVLENWREAKHWRVELWHSDDPLYDEPREIFSRQTIFNRVDNVAAKAKQRAYWDMHPDDRIANAGVKVE